MNRALAKIFSIAFVLWGVSTITFLILHLTPGDPADLILGDGASPADKAQLRISLHLNDPLPTQYFLFFKQLASFDFGTSFMTKKNVSQEIAHSLPATFELGLLTILFSICIAIPLGLMAAVKPKGPIDKFVDFFTAFGVAAPSFVIGPLFIIFFSIFLGWLPVSGTGGFSYIILPVLSLGVGISATLTGITRASCLEIFSSDFVRTAFAKGLASNVVYVKHVLRNALPPITTWLALQLGLVLTGVVVTETLFDWPGLGILFFTALKNRDYPLVQGCTMTVAIIYILVNLLTDLSYFILNPRRGDE